MENRTDYRKGRCRAPRWLAIWWLLAFIAAVLPGCSGCWSEPNPSSKDKSLESALDKKLPEKPKPPFEPLKISVLPEDDAEGNIRYIKPGHWTTAVVQAKANLNDFVGDLSFTPLDQSLAPALLDRTRFALSCVRPASLPKGQEKFIEQLIYVPSGRSTTSVSLQLRERRSGGESLRDSQVLTHLAAYQYQLVVLSANPNAYRYLKVLDSVKPRNEDFSDADQVWYYHVCLPKAQKQAPVSGESLAWTSTSHLIWDDMDFKLFRPEQQQAMIDWLQWGGQLIVSGPQSLDGLKGSFLEPFLPATSGGAFDIDDAALGPLSEYWSRSERDGPGQRLTTTRPWAGVRLQLAGNGEFIADTGQLLAQKRVGRGRVVTTAFRLSQRELLSWRSFDSFFNACILGRPPREFATRGSDVVATSWAGRGKDSRLDPTLVTHLRYFARDSLTPHKDSRYVHPDDAGKNQSGVNVYAYTSNPVDMMSINESRKEPGAAGWQDFNEVGLLVRQSLRDAAGITIPDAQFVAKTLAMYLLFVVPLNWVLFKAIGRVEWAWAAMPLLALLGAGTVVKMARLDIGFARSRNEVCVLEAQVDYPRAHLTRYTALYTSLATGYDCRLSGSAAALPFGRETLQLRNETLGAVELRRDADLRLAGFEVISNAADMLHTEQFVDLKQGFNWNDSPGEDRAVFNGTSLNLHGVVIARRPGRAEGFADAAAADRAATADNPPLEMAWIGDLAAGEAAKVQFSTDNEAMIADQLADSPVTQKESTKGTLNIRGLVDLATRQTSEPGETRLVGWTEELPPGMTIEPTASQLRHAMVVVVHLKHGETPRPRPDDRLPPAYVPPPDDDGIPLKPSAPISSSPSPATTSSSAPRSIAPTVDSPVVLPHSNVTIATRP